MHVTMARRSMRFWGLRSKRRILHALAGSLVGGSEKIRRAAAQIGHNVRLGWRLYACDGCYVLASSASRAFAWALMSASVFRSSASAAAFLARLAWATASACSSCSSSAFC